MTDQNWMDDPLLGDIDSARLEFMQKLVFDLYQMSEKERLPFLLALAGKLKKEQISFSADETERIITVLKKNGSRQEVEKMDRILKMFRSKTPVDADMADYDDIRI